MVLDVITIGRSSVDLYGAQVGGRLEDMASFRKYIGGSPTNMAAGAARLGLRAAVITRVGDEHMGRFIREELAREGVDLRGVVTDPARLTALVILGIRDERSFPLIFFRENCADMALSETDIDPAFIAEARSVVATGTHLSHPQPRAAVLKAVRLARANGALTVLDIDYRPNLWGLAGHGSGEARYIGSAAVTARLREVLPLFDLIVGTEEEFHVAGGSEDTGAALRAVRAVSAATLVCKRGPMGAVAFPGPIPDRLGDGIAGEGFPVEVFNVLGAGDGFMAGLLRGRLRGEDWPESLRLANACGAFAVSRHGCTPAYPSWEELRFFLRRGIVTPALRKDAELEHLHRATTRKGAWPALRVLALDGLAAPGGPLAGADPVRAAAFARLGLEAVQAAARGRPGFGLLCDDGPGRAALHAAAGTGLWIGRPVARPGAVPLDFAIGPDLGSDLMEWPLAHVVTLAWQGHPGDPPALRATEEDRLLRLADAARRQGLELLLALAPAARGPVGRDTLPALVRRLAGLGVRPDWWAAAPLPGPADWGALAGAVREADPWCRGLLVLLPDGAAEAAGPALAAAAGEPLVRGFLAGGGVLAGPSRDWLAGRLDDRGAVAAIAAGLDRLARAWAGARARTDPATASSEGDAS